MRLLFSLELAWLTSSSVLQKNVLWEAVEVGLEGQKFKGYVAILPPIHCDSQFPGLYIIFLIICLWLYK